MIHHHGKYRIARGTLARHSSGRLDSRDANQPSEYANPNVATRPCDPATERPRPPRAPLSRGSARWKPATRRPCLRSPQGRRLTRPRVDTCELDSCLRSCSILQRTFLSLSPDQVPLPIVRHPWFSFQFGRTSTPRSRRPVLVHSVGACRRTSFCHRSQRCRTNVSSKQDGRVCIRGADARDSRSVWRPTRRTRAS
jgi:hypothetical protein